MSADQLHIRFEPVTHRDGSVTFITQWERTHGDWSRAPVRSVDSIEAGKVQWFKLNPRTEPVFEAWPS